MGLGFQMCRYFVPTTNASHCSAYAHCEFYY